MVVNVDNYSFFDFGKFKNAIADHYKENAKLIGLTPEKVVSHKKELSNAGLVVDVYLVDGELLTDEQNSVVSIDQMFFCIEIILLGEAQSTSGKTYNELMNRTLKLALITEKLAAALHKFDFNCSVHLDRQIKSFRAVFDPFKSSDAVHNACAVYGSFSAFSRTQ